MVTGNAVLENSQGLAEFGDLVIEMVFVSEKCKRVPFFLDGLVNGYGTSGRS